MAKKYSPGIFIKSYGCAENRFYAQQLTFDLVKNDFSVYKQPFGSDRVMFNNKEERLFASQAKIFIIYTCPITHYLEELTSNFITNIKLINRKAIVIITGCSLRCGSSMLKKEKRTNKTNIIFIESGELMHYLAQFKNKKNKVNNCRFNHFEPATVLIKSGCSKNCSYCICPRVCRSSRCFGLSEIIQQIKALGPWRFSSVEFAGPCIGDWRDPVRPSFNFADLIKLVLNSTNLKVVNLEFHPADITEELIEVLARKNISNDISIPIQSGSDRILKKMNRKYRNSYLEQIFKKLFLKIPDLRLTTDIIVNFPSETKEDINYTIRLVKKFPFRRLDIYNYSPVWQILTPARKQNRIKGIDKAFLDLVDKNNPAISLNLTSC